jgi:hypothetical protein
MLSINENKRNRSNKKIYYGIEREQILNKIIPLINFDNENSILYIQLQENDTLKSELKNMVNEIKKYYRCSTWGYFVSLKKGEKCDEISLLKAIFKDHGYKIFTKEKMTDYNNIKKKYTKLYFNSQ